MTQTTTSTSSDGKSNSVGITANVNRSNRVSDTVCHRMRGGSKGPLVMPALKGGGDAYVTLEVGVSEVLKSPHSSDGSCFVTRRDLS